MSDDQAVALPDDAGTLDIEATFVSFDANGWTLNYSNVTNARYFFSLAIGQNPTVIYDSTYYGATLE